MIEKVAKKVNILMEGENKPQMDNSIPATRVRGEAELMWMLLRWTNRIASRAACVMEVGKVTQTKSLLSRSRVVARGLGERNGKE